MSKRARIASSLSIALACYGYFCVSGELYLSSDNVMVAVVTNGLFGTAPFCQYLHPLLCLIIRGASQLLPAADAFTVLKDILIFGELALLFYGLTAPLDTPSLIGKGIKHWQVEHFAILALAIMADVFLSMGINLWRANYTITTGSFAAVGLALLFAGRRFKHRWWCVFGTVYIAVAYMFRKECGLLTVPFFALHIAVDYMASPDRRAERRAFCRTTIPAIVIVAVLLASQTVFNSIEPYATAKRYSDTRTTCVDFPMKGWSDTDYPDKATYQAATDWTFIDTVNLTADTFEAVAKAGSRNQYELTQSGIRSALMEMRRVAFRTDVYMAVGVVLALLLASMNLIMGKGWRRVESVLAMLGAFIILFYFTIRGRAPLRVWQPVVFVALVVEAMIYVDNWKAGTLNIVSMLLIAILLYYSAGQVIAHSSFHAPVTAWTARIGADDSEYRDDTLYIWPNWHGTIPKFFAVQNKLPTRRVLEHNIAAGDWTYGQPFYNEFLERIGAANPAEELVEGRAYVMTGSGEIIEEYLKAYYGADIHLAPTGIVIDEREAYRVERMNKP